MDEELDGLIGGWIHKQIYRDWEVLCSGCSVNFMSEQLPWQGKMMLSLQDILHKIQKLSIVQVKERRKR